MYIRNADTHDILIMALCGMWHRRRRYIRFHDLIYTTKIFLSLSQEGKVTLQTYNWLEETLYYLKTSSSVTQMFDSNKYKNMGLC